MVRTVRVRYVPYAYGMKYAYGTQHYKAKKPKRSFRLDDTNKSNYLKIIS